MNLPIVLMGHFASVGRVRVIFPVGQDQRHRYKVETPYTDALGDECWRPYTDADGVHTATEVATSLMAEAFFSIVEGATRIGTPLLDGDRDAIGVKVQTGLPRGADHVLLDMTPPEPDTVAAAPSEDIPF